MDVCGKCGKPNGRPYTFYYGNTFTEMYGPTVKTIRTVDGSSTVHLCDACARSARRRMSKIFLIINGSIQAVFLIFMIIVKFDPASMIMLFPLIFMGVNIYHMYGPVRRKDAEGFAIGVGAGKFRAQGYRDFYTSYTYRLAFGKKPPAAIQAPVQVAASQPADNIQSTAE